MRFDGDGGGFVIVRYYCSGYASTGCIMTQIPLKILRVSHDSSFSARNDHLAERMQAGQVCSVLCVRNIDHIGTNGIEPSDSA
jgi:hypothetical protein